MAYGLGPTMGLEIALGSSPASVRASTMLRDGAAASPHGGAWCVVAPIAPPRLWQAVREVALKGFFTTLGDSTGAVPLQRSVGAASQSLTRLQAALVEPNLSLDAQMAAMTVQGDAAHLTLSSGMRIYRARNGEPKRLLNSAQRAPAISHGGMLVATERLLRGDLFVVGSRDAFAVRSIGNVAALLAQRPDATSAEVCEALLNPCRSAGVGVGVVVLRVR